LKIIPVKKRSLKIPDSELCKGKKSRKKDITEGGKLIKEKYVTLLKFWPTHLSLR
jgi:hypothetical protein